MRGNRVPAHQVRALLRSIPARAGEPKAFRIARVDDVVYPRACGGTHILLHSVKLGKGLSPRVRGNRSCASSLLTIGRSIPARAGEPFSILPSSGKPSARVGYRDTSNRASGSWKGHRARQQQQVRHDGTQADLFRRSVDTSRSPVATRTPSACASALLIRIERVSDPCNLPTFGDNRAAKRDRRWTPILFASGQ